MDMKWRSDADEGNIEEDFADRTNLEEVEEADGGGSSSEEEDDSRVYVETESDREKREANEKWFAESREMTAEEYFEYTRRVEESGGFDVPYYPNTFAIARIEPILNVEKSEKVSNLAKQALDVYNKQHSPSYKLKSVSKANSEVVAGFMYYITFEATIDDAEAKSDSDSETFQAKVWDGVKHVTVDSCQKISN